MQEESQKEDIISLLPKNKNIDYISCWFYKGAEYLNTSPCVKIAFVSTNSVCQGEQVAFLWKQLKKFTNVEIGFAYRSFKWTNNAKYNAGVTCVIIGLRQKSSAQKFIYDGLQKILVKNINAYLLDANDIYIDRRGKPLSNFPEISFGNMLIDGGFLVYTQPEIDKALVKDKDLMRYIKPYIGSQEFIKGTKRFCIWVEDYESETALKNLFVSSAVEKVKIFRSQSKREATRILSKTPWKFGFKSYKPTNAIIVPRVSSERRQYIPIGYLDKNTVISDSAHAIYDAPLWLFSVITSRMHMVWVRAVGGRLKTDYRYSAELCYNTFPFPDVSDQKKRELEYHAKQVLSAREAHSELTMAELYDPDKMPEDLRSAHVSLDIAVEQCYRKRPFDNDEKRLEYLFKYYEKMSAGSKLGQQELEIL